MIASKARVRLTEMKSELERIQVQVPKEAAGFFRACRRLDERIDTLLPSSWMAFPVSDDQIRLAADELENLRQLSVVATELIDTTLQIKGRIGELERFSAEPGKRYPWLFRQLDGWKAQAGRLQHRVGDIDQAELAREQLRDVSRQVDDARATTRKIAAARSLLDDIRDREGGAVPTAVIPLAQRLDALDAVLQKLEPPEVTWNEQMAEITRHLEEEASKAPPPLPHEASQSAAVLGKLQRWSTLLEGEGAQQRFQQLNQRYYTAEREWRRGQGNRFRELLEEVEALAQQLAEGASEQRRRRLEHLTRDLGLFEAAMATHGELDGRLRQLRGRQVETWREHQEWVDEHDDVLKTFEDLIATAHATGRLDRYIQSRIGEMQRQLSQLQAGPLDDAAQADIAAMQITMQRVQQAVTPKEQLQALRDMNALPARVDGHVHRISSTQRALAQRQQDFQQQWDALASLLQASDLAGLLPGTLPERTAESFGAWERWLADCESSLAALQDSVLAEAGARFQVRIAHCERLRAAMRAEPSLPELPSAPQPPEAQRMLVALQQAAAVANTLERRLSETLQKRQAEAADIQSALQDILSQSLSLDQEELIQDHLDLLGISMDTEVPALEQLATLDGVLHSVRHVLNTHYQQDQDAERRFNALRQQMLRLRRDLLHRHCGALRQRVELLVHGIGTDERRWSEWLPQIEAAESLIGQMLQQARRRAAADLDQIVTHLSEHARLCPDPNLSEDIQQLLDTIHAIGHEQLPPAHLRLRAKTLLSNANTASRGQR